jgi:transcriptional regulator with XRE-family HTH domain
MENYPLLADAIAETIEELRLERGLTKTALADFSALQRFYLLNIEKKTNRPTVNAIFFICDALSIRPSEFFALVEQRMESLKNRESP